jgi:type IV secretory pathway TrbD component
MSLANQIIWLVLLWFVIWYVRADSLRARVCDRH